ncbi:MAG TPA: hypothetical protein VM364_10285 [Vicinamibacterales bacterium]|nr:hypothetical protein [Vicinamibacterales bacterium]
MKTTVLAGMLMMLLALAPFAAAHEGHDYRIMGTVSTIHENHVEIAGTDKKTHTITLTDKTKVLRGTAKASAGDIRAGGRIAVTARQVKGKDGELTMVASEVRLPPPAAK